MGIAHQAVQRRPRKQETLLQKYPQVAQTQRLLITLHAFGDDLAAEVVAGLLEAAHHGVTAWILVDAFDQRQIGRVVLDIEDGSHPSDGLEPGLGDGIGWAGRGRPAGTGEDEDISTTTILIKNLMRFGINRSLTIDKEWQIVLKYLRYSCHCATGGQQK